MAWLLNWIGPSTLQTENQVKNTKKQEEGNKKWLVNPIYMGPMRDVCQNGGIHSTLYRCQLFSLFFSGLIGFIMFGGYGYNCDSITFVAFIFMYYS